MVKLLTCRGLVRPWGSAGSCAFPLPGQRETLQELPRSMLCTVLLGQGCTWLQAEIGAAVSYRVHCLYVCSTFGSHTILPPPPLPYSSAYPGINLIVFSFNSTYTLSYLLLTRHNSYHIQRREITVLHDGRGLNCYVLHRKFDSRCLMSR